MENELEGKRHEIETLVNSLETSLQTQEEIDNEFGIKCNEFVNKILGIFKENNITVQEDRIGLSLLNAMDVIRHRLSLRDRIRRGESISEEEREAMEVPNVREQCIAEFLKVIEAETSSIERRDKGE